MGLFLREQSVRRNIHAPECMLCDGENVHPIRKVGGEWKAVL